MKKILVALTVITLTLLLSACGGHSQPKVYPHSAQFLHQVQNTHIPRSELLTALPVIPGYDAVDTNSLPSNAQAVGCYAGPGIYNCTAAHNRAPNAKLVSIAQQASVPAKCLDTETGDAQPWQDLGWVKWMISRGVNRPCIYASLSEMSQVRANLSSLPRSSYLLWVAAWNGNSSIPAGYDAIQWFGNTHCCYDRDTFGSWFFGPRPVPNAPGCTSPSTSKSYCYGRFSNRVFYNPKKGDWCSKGCNEQKVVKAYDYHRTHKGYATAIKQDRARLAFLNTRLEYLIHHRSVSTNGKYYVYGREHNVYNRAYRGKTVVKTSWAGYNF